jgi:RNA polymerase sigma factor (TIGR02999 family)
MPTDNDITDLLIRAQRGDRSAESRLLDSIYQTLRELARSAISRHSETTLSVTGLVHESYLRLFDGLDMDWVNRRQFFAYAARSMRNLLVDKARRQASCKRGGDRQRDDEALDDFPFELDTDDVIDIDQALRSLERIDPRLAGVVELHVFGGLGFEEIAQHLGIGERTALRDWQVARLALKRLLSG